MEPRNPFPGLRPFEADEEHLFFGRERETDDLLRRLRSTRLLAVVGRSGSGKSSLVRSGLVPSLEGGYMAGASSTWRIAVMRPGEDPLGHLAHALAGEHVLGAVDADVAAAAPVIIDATLGRGPLGLVDAVRQARIPAGDNVLVLVDQFEELFRFRRNPHLAHSRDEAIAFVRLLLEAASQRELPIYVALTMRSDFIGDCMDLPGLSDAVNSGLYLVGRMSRDALRLAITGPVAVAGGAIAPRLVNRVLNDLGDDQDQLPLVQHALMRSWDHWAARRGERPPADTPIDVDDYEAVGTIAGALSQHAEEAYAECADAGLGTVAEQVFKALTDTFTDARGVRRPTSIAELTAITGAPEADVVRVVDLFRHPGRSFLMPPASFILAPASIVDISHESLMRCWARLMAWAEQERAAAEFYVRLAKAARWFEEGAAGLWRNPELELATRWRNETRPTAAWAHRYDEGFERAMAFLERSEDERARRADARERERRRTLRHARQIAGVLATLLVIAVVFGYVAWRESGRAERNLDLARAAVDESLSAADRNPARAGADVPALEQFRRELLAKAERFYVAFMQQAPRSEKLRRDVAFAHLRLGHIDRLLERRDEAAREYGDAIARFDALAAAHPKNPEYRAAAANAYNWLGETFRPQAGRYDDAERAYTRALDLQQQLVSERPGTSQYAVELARSHYNRGILRATRPANATSAEADFRESIARLEPLADADRRAAQELARAENDLGGLLAGIDGRAAEVRGWWEKAVAIDERLVAAEPENREFKVELALLLSNLASLLHDAGDTAEAERRSRHAVALMDDLARPSPSVVLARADAHDLNALILQARDTAEAEREYADAVDLFVDGARDPALARMPDYHLRFGDLLLNLAGFSAPAGRSTAARALLTRATRAYAGVAIDLAARAPAGDALLALETLTRVMPALPDPERQVLLEPERQLRRRVGR